MRVPNHSLHQSPSNVHLLLGFWAILLLVWPALVQAEQWSLDGEGEHPPPAPENRIIKWCSEDGSHVRYASSNIEIKGYTPCGKVGATTTCDASGNRMISKDPNRPHDHLDCGVGPRIFIMNHHEDDTIDLSALPEDDEQVGAMTEAEKRALEKEVQEAYKRDPNLQLQHVAERLIRMMFAANPLDNKSKRERRNTRKQADEILKSFDPQTREALEKFLDTKHWHKTFPKR